MRAFIHYQLQIDYLEPARGLTQVLRLHPRGFDTQYVQDWFVGVEPEARLRRSEDAFGNIVHSCSHDGPLERLTISAEGEIETNDAAGVVAGQYEKFPHAIYLRDLASTHASARMSEFLRDSLASETDPLGRMHALMGALHDKLGFEPDETPAPRPAAEVFESGRGSARELAQVMVAAAREENAPARFISGFFLGGATDQRFSTKGGASETGVAAAHHAWAEIYVDPIGWIGFDPALGYCPRDEHLRIAQGLDYFGAAPRRGASFGSGREEAVTRLTLDFGRQANWQTQQ